MESNGHDFIHKRLKSYGPALAGEKEEEMLFFLLSTARGIHHLHKNGIMHRDIKPANVR